MSAHGMTRRVALAVAALDASIRTGELTPEQRELLISLLHHLATAVALAPQADERYPLAPIQREAYRSACYQPVADGFGALLATACGGQS